MYLDISNFPQQSYKMRDSSEFVQAPHWVVERMDYSCFFTQFLRLICEVGISCWVSVEMLHPEPFPQTFIEI